METGFAVTAFIAIVLNLILEEEIEDEETPELTADTVDAEEDRAEWSHIERHAGEKEGMGEPISSADAAAPSKKVR